MELYPIQISEVHQTHPAHMKFIWACRECLGHPISKKNWVKRWILGWVIAGISFWTTKLTTTSWLTTTNYTILHYNKWLTTNLTTTNLTDWLQTSTWLATNFNLIDYKLTSCLTNLTHWPQSDWTTNDHKLTDYKWFTTNDYKLDFGYKMTTNWSTYE
jgi:hypothetical protein